MFTCCLSFSGDLITRVVQFFHFVCVVYRIKSPMQQFWAPCVCFGGISTHKRRSFRRTARIWVWAGAYGRSWSITRKAPFGMKLFPMISRCIRVCVPMRCVCLSPLQACGRPAFNLPGALLPLQWWKRNDSHTNTHTQTHKLSLIKFRNSHLIALTPASLFPSSRCSAQSLTISILSLLITYFLSIPTWPECACGCRTQGEKLNQLSTKRCFILFIFFFCRLCSGRFFQVTNQLRVLIQFRPAVQ